MRRRCVLNCQLCCFAALFLAIANTVSAQEELPSSTSDSNVGYIDNAMIGSQFRLRFDAAFGNNRPDRAEYFYAKCGCFANPFNLVDLQDALDSLGQFDPNAAGPPGQPSPGPVGQPVETNVDFQDFWAYMEYAPVPWLSGFVELPIRFLNPEINNNTAGLADIRAGLKVELWSACDYDSVLTFQLRTYFPTGDADRGLGTDHFSLEPGLLYYIALTDRIAVEAELLDWIGIPGSDFTGNVLQYGVGANYELLNPCCGPSLSPVVEFVGWTVLDGKKVPEPGPSVSAVGDSIVNAKFGVRYKDCDGSSLYAGYGTALTGDVWYDDIVRIEYRSTF